MIGGVTPKKKPDCLQVQDESSNDYSSNEISDETEDLFGKHIKTLNEKIEIERSLD